MKIKQVVFCKVLIGFLLFGCAISCLYYIRFTESKKHAYRTFKMALAREIDALPTYKETMNVDSRFNLLFCDSSSRYMLNDSAVDGVHVYSNNGIQQAFLSLLVNFGISADSVNYRWMRILDGESFYGYTQVCLSAYDSIGTKQILFSRQNTPISSDDSLTTCYMGPDNELIATGYYSLPIYKAFSLSDIFIWLCVFLIYFVFIKKKYFFSTESLPEVESVISESVNLFDPNSHSLGSDVTFHTTSRLISGRNKNVKLQPVPAAILKALLEANQHKLTVEELMAIVWPDKTVSKSNVHTSVKRLRDVLDSVTFCQIDNYNSTYQLILPE